MANRTEARMQKIKIYEETPKTGLFLSKLHDILLFVAGWGGGGFAS